MFVIRSAQIETLSDSFREPFRGRILAFIQGTIPERTRGMTEDQVKARVADADRRAVRHGLKTERGIFLFAALDFLVGPKFDEKPEIRALLDLPQPSQDLKIRWLVKALAIYKKNQEAEIGVIRKLAEGGQQFLGGLLAAMLSPFLLCASGAGVLTGGVSYGVNLEAAAAAASGAAEAIGGALLVAGEVALAVASSPITLGILAVAVVAVGIYLVANQAHQVDQAADKAADDDAPSDTQECPKSEQGTSPPEKPEGGEDPEPEDDQGRNDPGSGNETPKSRSLNNIEARDWYNEQVKSINEVESQMRAEGKSSKEIFETTTQMRNEAKLQARDLMKDQDLAKSLPSPKTPEEILEKYDGDFEKAIEATKRTNPGVNQAIEEQRARSGK